MQQPAEQDALIGLNIGNYEIKQKLGEGGMGAVYLAEHPLIGKKVALKVLHAEFASNRDVVSRFFTEAKSVNDIQHPNIVDIVDYGEIVQDTGADMVYFIMEFLAGDSLVELIKNEAPLAPERALAICIQIADALAASHGHNIVHRDLKPDNVILIQRGRQNDFVKVLDFGIAKLTGDQPGSRRTRTGIVMGTPAYMSPEQCEGRGNVDHRTDVYALGILLYEMITGRVPFEGEGYGEVLVQHLTQTPARPTTIRGVIPPHVEAVCMKALEKRPDARYPNMEEFMRALADPVGYVEGNGGIPGFVTTELTPGGYLSAAAAQVPGPAMPTPSPINPISPLTPAPGALAPVTPGATQMPGPVPGQMYTQTPTPAPFEFDMPGKRSRAGLIAGIVVAVAVVAGGGFLVLRGGGGSDDGDKKGSDVTEVERDPGGEKAGAPGAETGPATAGPKDETGPEAAVKDGDEVPGGDVSDTPPDPPEPVLITVKVGSSPQGADIYVGDEKKPRGKTPTEFQLEKGDEKVKITLKRSGYKDREESIVPNKNSFLDWNLRKKRKRGGDRAKPDKDELEDTELLGPSFGRKRR